MQESKSRREMEWEDRKRLAIKYADGERTFKELCTIVGCGESTMLKWQKELSLKIRKER